MSSLDTLECTNCGKTFSPCQPQTVCSACNHTLYARYNLDNIKNSIDKEDLDGRRPSMWRYFEFLPVHHKENIVSLGEGYTPLHKLPQFAKTIEIDFLYVKDEGINPTGTFKSRGLSMAVSKAKELGMNKLAIPSAGNAAGALATYGAKAGLEIYVVMPADAPKTCKIENFMTGAHIYQVDGLISECGKIVEEGKDEIGWFSVSTTKEPYRVEGKKTMGLEIAEQFNWTLPDVILYPTGGGTGLIGMWKAFNELQTMGWINDTLPRMIAVQAEGCAPIVEAYKKGQDTSEFWEDATTLAGGIRVPKAFADDLILEALYDSKGCAVAVSEDQILESAKELAEKGIFACPEGSATLAGLKKLRTQEKIQQDDQVVLYNTGTGLKYTDVFADHINIEIPKINSVKDISKHINSSEGKHK